MKKILYCLCIYTAVANTQDLITVFPLDNYDQNVTNWINSKTDTYDSPLVSKTYQQKRFAEFYSHYYSSDTNGLSPWSSEYVKNQLANWQEKGVVAMQEQVYNTFYQQRNEPDHTGYGENYRPYPDSWYAEIATNMQLWQQKNQSGYHKYNRAIVIDNAYVRSFPTIDPFFYSNKLAGEGYPFDNLQQSAVFVGMPVYIVQQSADKAWSLVISSDDVGWVPTNSVARVSDGFIHNWQATAKNGIVAIIKKSSLLGKNGQYYASIYNGGSLPLYQASSIKYTVLVPRIGTDGLAHIAKADLPRDNAAIMPLALTPHNIANIISNQIGKPYGWGSMFFDYDCSAEMKALFAPFGIYLPRNSKDQSSAGTKVAILDKLSAKEREQYLLEYGHPMVTLIQIPGHIMLYLGKYPNPFTTKHELVAYTYQNIWGMRTSENNSRAVIGKSVIFPLLNNYPENSRFLSFYDDSKRRQFRLVFLDEDTNTPNGQK